jgi:hypothetical protein
MPGMPFADGSGAEKAGSQEIKAEKKGCKALRQNYGCENCELERG